MRALPRLIRFELAGLQLAVIHGGQEDISQWIFKSTPEEIKRNEITHLEKSGPVDVVIGGHCGLPFVEDLGDVLWLNPGVIGMPANDGTTRTWFSVLTAIYMWLVKVLEGYFGIAGQQALLLTQEQVR